MADPNDAAGGGADGGEGAAKPPMLGRETTAATPPPGTTPPTEGAAAADVRDWLAEEYRTDPVFKDIKDPAALAKSYKHAASMVGLDKGAVLRLPADGDEAAMGEVFNRLGRPETPDKYQFPELPAALAEGVEPAARAEFHKLGLTAKQAAGVMGLYGGQVTAQETARIARATEMEAAVEADLRREYGDKFDDMLHSANRAIAEIGGKELGVLLFNTRMPDGTHMGNHPLLVKAFAEIGKRIAEPDTLKGGSTGGGSAALTPDQADAEIKALRSDTAFHAARRDPKHADHAKNTERWARLNQAAAAGRGMVA